MVTFERGLPHLVSVNAARYLQDPSSLSALFDAEPLLGLRVLSLDEEQLRALAASPSLRAVHTLDLAGWDIGDTGARILASSPNLARITSLNLAGNSLTDEGVSALAESSHLQALRCLNLTHNRITVNGALTALRSPHLAKLQSLNVDHNFIDRHALAEIDRALAARTPGYQAPPRVPQVGPI